LLWLGDAYGRENCLTVDKKPLIEFWDREIAGKPYKTWEADALGSPCWPEDGQFASRYYVETFMDRDEWGHPPGHGLDLVGHVAAWKLSGTDVTLVQAWVEGVEKGREHGR
jgi:hypothetical protein